MLLMKIYMSPGQDTNKIGIRKTQNCNDFFNQSYKIHLFTLSVCQWPYMIPFNDDPAERRGKSLKY